MRGDRSLRANSSTYRRNRVERCRATAGEPWAAQDAAAAGFLREDDGAPSGRDLADGFALTGFFLTRHVLEPRGISLGDERAHFIAALARVLPSVA